ncbi:MAG: SGNH/GDSL hydrolase family protein [Clostridia bacterium]|nr:SGNH/GDSL hydrolase family protein [Clostridia bacterium]
MEFFDTFISCTAAGSGSQNWFETEAPEQVYRSRVYYRLSRSIKRCALLYSNLIDSTYSDGSHSHANYVPDEWTIYSLRVGAVEYCGMEEAAEPEAFVDVSFDGKASKRVKPGEIFSSDAIELKAEKNTYLCVETAYSGWRIPCHTESLLPAFRFTDGVWQHSTEFPFPSMLASDRGNEIRIGFIGDSITQGIGTLPNTYTHVAALAQEVLGESCAVWNLGLGFGRAHDAALDGGWLYKARQNDVVCVCFGVNDLFQLGDAALLKRDLAYIVRTLKKCGIKTLIQTVPPFDYAPEPRAKWLEVNDYIRSELSTEADAFFDNVPVLSKSESEPHASRYGSHPNAEGNAAWAEALLPEIRKLL